MNCVTDVGSIKIWCTAGGNLALQQSLGAVRPVVVALERYACLVACPSQWREHSSCQRNSSFLTHFAFVDCVNSDSCYCDPEVTIKSCHVLFLRKHCRVQTSPKVCVARDDRGLVVESLLCVTQVV